MAKKKVAGKTPSGTKAKGIDRDDIAVRVASGLAHLSAQGNQINYEKVAVNAYGIADALIALKGK